MKFQFHWPGIRGMWVSSNGWNVERGESYVRGGLVLAPWKVLEGYWYLVVDGERAARIGLKGLGMYSSAYTSPWPCCWPSTMTHEPWKRNCSAASPGPAPRIPSRLSQFERAHSWKLTTRALPHSTSPELIVLLLLLPLLLFLFITHPSWEKFFRLGRIYFVTRWLNSLSVIVVIGVCIMFEVELFFVKRRSKNFLVKGNWKFWRGIEFESERGIKFSDLNSYFQRCIIDDFF